MPFEPLCPSLRLFLAALSPVLQVSHLFPVDLSSVLALLGLREFQMHVESFGEDAVNFQDRISCILVSMGFSSRVSVV